MRRKRFIHWVLYTSVALLLLVGIPLVINELYKIGTGYMTVWGAADLLSYYGTVLGSCVTVGALIITILFTKKQIQRGSFIKNQEEKWNRIESLISSSLENIHPARIAEIVLRVTSSNYNEAPTAFHQYSLQAKTALDSVFAYISGEDYKQLESLLQAIQDAADEYCVIAAQLESQYQNLELLELRKDAIKINNMARQNPAKNMADLISSGDFLTKTSSLNEKEIREEINKLSEKLSAMRDTSYRGLLEKKRITFSEIQDRWVKEADNMLHLWRY